jgi:hypothetical protein
MPVKESGNTAFEQVSVQRSRPASQAQDDTIDVSRGLRLKNLSVVTKNVCSNGNGTLETDTAVNSATNFIKNGLTM